MHKGKAIRIHSVKRTQTHCIKITQKLRIRYCKLRTCILPTHHVHRLFCINHSINRKGRIRFTDGGKKKKRTRIRAQSRGREPIRISQPAFILLRFIRESLHTQSSSEMFCLIKSYDRWRFVCQWPVRKDLTREKYFARYRNGRLLCSYVWICQPTLIPKYTVKNYNENQQHSTKASESWWGAKLLKCWPQ